MTCEVCGVGEQQEMLIRYSLLMDDRLVVVEHVPALVCNHCGETTLSPEVVTQLQQTVSGGPVPLRTLETPVYEFVGAGRE